MSEFSFERQPSPAKLEILGVFEWPIWEKEVSEFEWTYDKTETCYFLRGQVIITPEGAEPLEFGRGDLVTFPAGMTCTWKVLQPVEKLYSIG